ncbi:DUF4159 domain-containing protein [Methyloceanibacter sp. wino2]|uniref:DUF4159 domain-containing protein n=1 Tax=Methyloceanibacter sp. wino2 TaxID=2170729 RepID=UPI001FE07651|nr:DUF4159 domain-containing protein [Methyloceanibacter sp. wino2]
MMTLGPIGFMQPWILLALAALPAIWWLLRFTPPSPKVVEFPPTRLLAELKPTEETPARSPWWLTLMRMLLAALLILALARPVINPDEGRFTGEGTMLLVVDNGWASAAYWNARREAIEAAIDRADRGDRNVLIVPTAATDEIGEALPADAVRERIAGLVPQPFAPDREAVTATMKEALKETSGYSVIWLSDGLDYGHAEDFASWLGTLADGGGLTVLKPGPLETPLGVGHARAEGGTLAGRVVAGAEGPISGTIRAVTARGEPLGEAPFTIKRGETEAIAPFDLPLEIRNQVARLQIKGQRSASAVHLLDAQSQWHRVGIVSGESQEEAQPLLSPLYYVERALSPYADVLIPTEANVATAINDLIDKQRVSTIVLADIGRLTPATQEELEAWLDKGGVLIRFAGPRLEQGGDELLPVALRRGGRSLGGALSWGTPQPLSPFEDKSPFYGLDVPEDIRVNRQVLADPAVTMDAEIWATLTDGTPLVTAKRQGDGWVVLFHVTANSDWSNLPLSGLFVQMLRQTMALGPSQILSSTDEGDGTADAAADTPRRAATTALAPVQTLDGFGQLVPPPLNAAPIAPDQFAKTVAGPDHPPGYYGPSGQARALNIVKTDTKFVPLPDVAGASTVGFYTLKKPFALEPWLYLAALGLFALDILAVLALSTGLGFRRPHRATAAMVFAMLLAAAGAAPHAAQAQDTDTVETAAKSDADAEEFALNATLKTRLAYVLTGDSRIDRTSQDGLLGLSKVLGARTALEPGAPMGVDIETDDLSFFPVLYWPVREDAESLSDETLAKVDAYMKQGGMIVFDTRDQERVAYGGSQGKALTRLIGRLDLPALEPVPGNHVLTRSFYLMNSFPGRWDGGSLWVEAEPANEAERNARARRTDGVSSVVVTSNDFASAWALDDSNRPLYPVVPGGELQREMSFRAGVNLVMYALTGNYKADQVHVPALLERLGQ